MTSERDPERRSLRRPREAAHRVAPRVLPVLPATLATVGFGGPIALAGYMQRDLVERRALDYKKDYVAGAGAGAAGAGSAGGPAGDLPRLGQGGRARRDAVAAAFILPSFVMVLALSALYVRFGGLAWMQSAFYGIGAAVIAIVARSALKLVKMTLAQDRLLWAVFVASAVATAWTESEIVWLFLASGVVVLLVRAPAALPPPAGAALLGPGVLGPGWRRRCRAVMPAPSLAAAGPDRPLLRRGRRLRVRQRAGHRPVSPRRRGEPAPLADRAPVPGRGRGCDDHARAGRHHGGVHRLPGRRAAGGDRRRSRRLLALLPVRRSSPRRTSGASRETAG